MSINRDGIIRLFVTIGISICISVQTSLFVMEETLGILFILLSVLLGSGIWLIAEISLELIDRVWPHSVLPSYVVLFTIICIGTVTGLILFGMRSVSIIIIICAIAEVCGLSIAIVSRQIYKNKLNEKLREYRDSDNI